MNGRKRSNLPPAMSKRRRMQTVTTLPEPPRFPPEPFLSFGVWSFSSFYYAYMVRFIECLVSWPSWQRCAQFCCCVAVSAGYGDQNSHRGFHQIIFLWGPQVKKQ